MRSALLPLTALLGVAAVAVLVWRGGVPIGREGGHEEASSAAPTPSAPSAPPTLLRGSTGEAGTELARAPNGRATVVTATDPFVETGPPDEIRIDGTVRMRDDSEVPPAGAIYVRRIDAPDPAGTSSEVIRGRFRLWIPAPGRYRVDTLSLGDEMYRHQVAERDLASGVPWDLVLEPMQAGTVVLVDEDSGAPLPDGVMLLEDRPYSGAPEETPNFVQPPRARAFVPFGARVESAELAKLQVDAEGRVRLPRCWNVLATVGAPGHVWRTVAMRLSESTTMTVRLARAGAVDLTVSAWDPLDGLHVQAGTSSESIVFDVDVDQRGCAALEGLPPGEWTFRLSSRGRERGKTTVVVLAGQRTPAVLEFARPVPGASVALRGTLRIPSGWLEDGEDDEGPRWLALHGVEPATREIERFQARPRSATTDVPFAFDSVPPGRYVLGVDCLPFEVPLVAAAGAGPLVLEVAAPVLLTVALVDADTQAPIENARVVWQASGSIPLATRLGRQRPSGLTLPVPVGMPGFLHVRARGYVSPGTRFEEENGTYGPLVPLEALAAGPAEQRVEIALHRAATLRVRFRDAEGGNVEASAGVRCFTPGAAGRAEVFAEWVGNDPNGGVLYDVPPGRSTLEIALDEQAFLPVAPLEIEARAGETLDVVVTVTPKK